MNTLIPAATAAIIVALTAGPAPASPISPGRGLENQPAGGVQLVHQGHDHVHGTGTVTSVDKDGRKVTLSHGPMPQVGWPAMTMEFAVAPSVDLAAIVPGARVDFTLDRGPDGEFQVEALTPAAEGK